MFFRYAVSTSFTLSLTFTNLFSVQEPASATQSFSSSRDPTVWRVIPILEFLIKTWENMAEESQYGVVHDALNKGLENLNKWYKKTDDSGAYFICLGTFIQILSKSCKHLLLHSALDPNFKVVYAEHHWGDDFLKAGLEMLGAVVSVP